MFVDKEKIAKAKEKLGDRNADIIAELLHLEKYDEVNKKALCPWHLEDTPSFIYNPKNYNWHCFGCSKNTDIIDAYIYSGMTYLEAVETLFKEANITYAFGEKGVKTKAQYRYPKPTPLNDKQNVYKYANIRKISKETIDYADVREDEYGNVVFNYYDTNDVLTTVKYRPARKLNKGENKTWCQKDADTTPLLFNMNKVNTSQALAITEGEWDALALIEAGYTNVVSVPFGAGNFSWIEQNFDWLEQFDSIIICADNDEAGIKMQKECVYRLGSWRTKFVEVPKTTVNQETGEVIPMKDLNEVLFYEGATAVMNLIATAKDSPVDTVKDFSDIDDLDLDEMDGIKTGFSELDKRIFKLFYGTLTILTGVNGGGKSSWLSQLICNTLDDDKNVYLYSGELPNFQSKNWLNYIFAGQRNLKEYVTEETKYWKMPSVVKTAISNHYKQRLFIHKDGCDHHVDTILKTMEDTTRKYGVKLHIIDNLTSVNLGSNENDKYQKQEEFITKLIAFSQKFNVAVLLVVHPHKIDTMRRLTKMDIQGISAIIDLAHRIFSLYRVSNEDKKGIPSRKGQGWFKEPIKYDVLLDVLKDRMRGFEGSSIGMYYDTPSRRFFNDIASLDHRYKWDTKEYTDELPYPPLQLLEQDEEEVFGNIQGGNG